MTVLRRVTSRNPVRGHGVRASEAGPPCGVAHAARPGLSDSARRSTDRTSQEEER